MEQETLRQRRALTRCAMLCVLLLTLTAIGCRSTTLPGISPDPSPLEQVVSAMTREEWEQADRLLMPILPPLPEDRSAEGDRSVALGE